MSQPSISIAMTGTAAQIEWAQHIRPQVNAEFDRVANAFRQVAVNQQEPDRTDTLAVITILEEKRAAVMQLNSAGYFIQHWRELHNQVRCMIVDHPRYQAIQIARQARSRTLEQGTDAI